MVRQSLQLRLTEMTGHGPRLLLQQRHRGVGSSAEAGAAYAGLRRSKGAAIGTKFLALDHSFHGRTIGSVATTEKAKYREPFVPVMPGVEFVPLQRCRGSYAQFSNEYCGICLEAIQGEGGIRPVSQEFLAAARELTRSTGALLIVDEIQAGLGRTGKWCAYQHYGIQPDITTLAKPLAGGLPMGAMLCTDEVASAMQPGMHGTTFGGGPLACAVAIAVIDTMKRDDMLAHVSEVGSYFAGSLRGPAQHSAIVTDVRGIGLMLALELRSAEQPSRSPLTCSSGTSSSTAPAKRCCVFFRLSSSASRTSTLPLLHLTTS